MSMSNLECMHMSEETPDAHNARQGFSQRDAGSSRGSHANGFNAPPIIIMQSGGGTRAPFSERTAEAVAEQVILTAAVRIAIHYVDKWLNGGNTEADIQKFALENARQEKKIMEEFRRLEGAYMKCQRKIARGEACQKDCQDIEDEFLEVGGHQAMDIIRKYATKNKYQPEQENLKPDFDFGAEFNPLAQQFTPSAEAAEVPA